MEKDNAFHSENYYIENRLLQKSDYAKSTLKSLDHSVNTRSNFHTAIFPLRKWAFQCPYYKISTNEYLFHYKCDHQNS